MLRSIIAVVAVVALGAPPPVAHAADAPLTPVTFALISPNASEWPVFIARAAGLFRAEGLDVTILTAGSPPNVMNALATDGANIGDTGSDTAIAAIAHGLGVTIVAPMFTVDPFVLVVPASITSWNDLRGKSVVLATKQDVTAMSFASMAAKNHAKLDDFSLIVSGDSSARYAALASGNVQGAMLSQPFDLEAEANGMHALASSADTMHDWVFKTVTVNRAWATANRAVVVRVLRALRAAIRYGYTHRDATIAVLVDATHAKPDIAARTYDVDFDSWHAFEPGLAMNRPGLLNVARAQVAFGALAALPTIGELYDGSFVAALGR